MLHSTDPVGLENEETNFRRPLSSILRELLVELDMTEADLAHGTDLPQSTVNRLLGGSTVDPRASTLTPIARFFDLSMDELLGLVPMSSRMRGSYRADPANAKAIPVIGWEDVSRWTDLQHSMTTHNHPNWLVVDQFTTSEGFGVVALSQHEPFFHRGSTLIVDTQRQPWDEAAVILLIEQSQAVIRRLLRQSSGWYAANMKENLLPPEPIDEGQVVGTIVEVRLKMA